MLVDLKGILIVSDTDQLLITYKENAQEDVRIFAKKNQKIGFFTGNIKILFGTVLYYEIELLVPEFIGRKVFAIFTTSYSTVKTLSESTRAKSVIDDIILNNKLIYENLLFCSRLVNDSTTDIAKIKILFEKLTKRDSHLRSTDFKISAEISVSNLNKLLSYLIQVTNVDYSDLVTNFDFNPSNAPVDYITTVNPLSAIVSLLFSNDNTQSFEDLYVSQDILYALAAKNNVGVNQLRSELINIIDIYALNKRLGYTPPAIPTVASVTQPTFDSKSGTIVITPQSGCEYSLDNRNYSASNTFGNLIPGNYTLYVRKLSDTSNVERSDNTVTINEVPLSPNVDTNTPESDNKTSTGKIIVYAGIALGVLKLLLP